MISPSRSWTGLAALALRLAGVTICPAHAELLMAGSLLVGGQKGAHCVVLMLVYWCSMVLRLTEALAPSLFLEPQKKRKECPEAWEKSKCALRAVSKSVRSR